MPIKIEAKPMLELVVNGEEQLDPVLLGLLQQLQIDSRLTMAARVLGVSYRHAWNVIRKWNGLFGQPVAEHQRGRGTQLTALGEKLVWAAQLVDAQLGPQVTSLGSVINHELSELLGGEKQPFKIQASHGYAIALLHELLERETGFPIGVKYTGSLSAVEALSKEHCEVVGFHFPMHTKLSVRTCRKYAKFLSARSYVIIQMVSRQQGLMVAKSNPMQIHYLNQLAQPEVRFINRQTAAGTRVLLDELLQLAGVETSEINGYDQEEYTHSAVAAYVASNIADVGFGIQYAAEKFNLDFVPIIKERYVLACEKKWLKSAHGSLLLKILKSPEFADGVAELRGYDLQNPGEVMSIEKCMQENA